MPDMLLMKKKNFKRVIFQYVEEKAAKVIDEAMPSDLIILIVNRLTTGVDIVGAYQYTRETFEEMLRWP